MISIDDVIQSLPTISETKRATWATNAVRIIARGPRHNPAYANAQRLLDAIAVYEATRPAKDDLIAACGLAWDRMVKNRTTFRGFDGERLVARISRNKLGMFVVQVRGVALSRSFDTLRSARAAAAAALQGGADHAPAELLQAA